MFKNYFKTAWRNLVRYKSNAFINIAGLMVGFAAFLLIFLVIQYEKSFDDFHANKNDIYRIVRIGKNLVNKEDRAGIHYPVTSTLRSDFPQLKNAAAIWSPGSVQVNVTATDGSISKKFKEINGVFLAEPRFFKMFNFSLAAGNIADAINDPNTALVTKEYAIKYFGDWKSAIGKTFSIFGLPIKVTGILNNPPSNTDFPLGVVVSYATLTTNIDMSNWGSIDDQNYCFVQLDNKYSRAQFNSLLARFVDKHIKPVNPNYDLSLQPLNEIHYDERFGNFTGRTFSKDLIFALSLIALFLLIIACVNFINLTTAQAVNRSREVGVRKVLGSNRKQLVLQFLGETAFITIAAVVLAILVAEVTLPLLNKLLETKMTMNLVFNHWLILFILIITISVTVLSGLYPAIILSGFSPITALKSKITSKMVGGISMRRVLVVLQFAIAQVLIIGMLIVVSQMNFFRNASLGFDKAAIINVPMPSDSLSKTKVDYMRNQLLANNNITNASFSFASPSSEGNWNSDFKFDHA